MKISQSVRTLYDEIKSDYQRLKNLVDERISNKKDRRWHYESRIKELESYALKLETGREKHPGEPEDMLGCTIVVENHSRISAAVSMVTQLFQKKHQRPKHADVTSLSPQDFSFEDLRLYVSWIDDDTRPKTGLSGLLFEVQIKTFLQHAWGIATHDLLYKADSVNWGTSRVAFQVKAMLENAELSISEAKRLTDCAMLDRKDDRTRTIDETISNLKARWPEVGMLPKDVQRLALNVMHLAKRLQLNLNDVWAVLDKATQDGRGAKLCDLSPYGAICEALITDRGTALFNSLAPGRDKDCLFFPSEVELPKLEDSVRKIIVRPTS